MLKKTTGCFCSCTLALALPELLRVRVAFLDIRERISHVSLRFTGPVRVELPVHADGAGWFSIYVEESHSDLYFFPVSDMICIYSYKKLFIIHSS